MDKIDIIISSDSHYDLKSEGIDRNDDIYSSNKQILEYILNVKKENDKIIHCFLGDLFHNTRPSSESIARAIEFYKILNENKIYSINIPGNHDVIDRFDKTSAFEPIKAIGFKYIQVFDDISIFNVYGINFITLPYISKSKAVKMGFKDVQEYIDDNCEKIETILQIDNCNIVLSHLNVSGAKVGTESFMIKGKDKSFPDCLKNSKKIKYIFNGHFHKPQLIKNKYAPIIMTGSIQVNDFSERFDEKNFFHLKIN